MTSLYMARLNAGGSFDLTFFLSEFGLLKDSVLMPDGKIVAAG